VTDLARFRQLEFEIMHQHNDGTWNAMKETSPHDAAGLDPERDWANHRIFQCTRCAETITVRPAGEDEPPLP
jgi:hypothetical protein